MNKKPLLQLLICIILCVGLVLGLYLSSIKPNDNNGFIRKFNLNSITHLKQIDIKYNSYYIAGLEDNEIYLGNSTAPTHLLKVDYNLVDTQAISINVPEKSNIKWQSINTNINNDTIYMIEGIKPTYLIGSLRRRNVHRQQLEKIRFDKQIAISAKSIAFRTADDKLHQNILSKATITPTSKLIRKNFVLEKQIDGFFCTDGNLIYDKKSEKFIYYYYYRNQFVCLDTNFNLVYKGRTIDTVSRANIKIAKMKSENRTTFAAPPTVINSQGCIAENIFYLISKLKADNEEKESFTKNIAVDMYSMNNGSYVSSFYLPLIEGHPISSFQIKGNTLFAIYDKYLVKFRMNSINKK